MALGAGVWLYRHRPRWPRLAGFREITFDGRMKVGREYPLPLFSDGLRIYFTEQTQAGHTLMYTGLEGGYAAAFGRTVTPIYICRPSRPRWAASSGHSARGWRGLEGHNRPLVTRLHGLDEIYSVRWTLR